MVVELDVTSIVTKNGKNKKIMQKKMRDEGNLTRRIDTAIDSGSVLQIENKSS